MMNYYTQQILRYWHEIKRVQKNKLSRHSKIVAVSRIIEDIGFDKGMMHSLKDFDEKTRIGYARRYRKLLDKCVDVLK